MTWREIAAPIIRRILAETTALPQSEVRRRLREAYPFGERVGHPYRIWREEIERQGGPHRSRSGGMRSGEDYGGEEPPPARDLPPAGEEPPSARSFPPASPHPHDRRRAASRGAAPHTPAGREDETGPERYDDHTILHPVGTELPVELTHRSRPPEPRAQAVREPFFVDDRVEHLPPGPCCRDCRHLGALLSVTDFRGIKRLRRACAAHPLGFTAPDWTACPAFDPRDTPGAA